MFESPSELNQGGGLDRNAPLIESRPRPYSKANPNRFKVATLFEPDELNQGRDLDLEAAGKTPYTQDGQKWFKSDITLTRNRMLLKAVQFGTGWARG